MTEHTLRDKVAARIGELETEIAAKRATLGRWLREADNPRYDKFPFATFNRLMNTWERQGVELEDEIDDLVRRRDLLLASPLLAENPPETP